MTSKNQPTKPHCEELESALHDPRSLFDDPDDVLEQADWSDEQKLSVLEQWKLDAERLQVASAENMAGGEPDLLRAVHLAIDRLQRPESAEGEDG